MSEAAPQSEMTEQDWQDVAESECVDFVESGIQGDPGFVFEHSEIGHHGFRLRKESGVLEPCVFDQLQDNDSDE